MTQRGPGRVVAMGLLTAVLALTAVVVAPKAHSVPAVASVSASHAAFHKTEKLTRTNLVNGQDQLVDKRTFSVSVDQTHNLRDRQEINVSWSGAHPTGGIFADPNSYKADEEEYPVVLMECRGVANSSTPSKRISPKTCYTQTPQERVQSNDREDSNFPAYRLDRYAAPADRSLSVGRPSPYPKACPDSSGADHWVPFVGANGKTFFGGPSQGCAGIAPEQTTVDPSLQPGNTTYAVTDLQGKGSDKFVINTSETNATLGCSDTVPCSLVIVPIMGISCDPSASSLPPVDRPTAGSERDTAFSVCSEKGAYPPGALSSGLPQAEDLAVSGSLWWSASNWRKRVSVPLTFAPPSNVCSLENTSAPTDIYGSYLMLQATQQWSPHFCLNKSLFALQHVQTGEPEAKNLLQAGSIDAAFQASPPTTPFTKPTVQAPTAVSGFAIVYSVDNAKGHALTTLNLDARLLAKLLTESYPSNSVIQSQYKALTNPKTGKPNPLDMAVDPEFRALNPGMPKNVLTPEPASTLLSIAADSDVTAALTSYINADPEARAWLDGKPDPWGMVVNPKYKGISLPVTNFPLLDTYKSPALDDPTKNPCLASDPVPWLPLVAAPVQNPATITLDMQFDIANPQINCTNAGAPNQKLAGLGRETPGQRFLVGITSLADAARYQLNTASLETQGGSTSSAQFTSTAGRTFVKPTVASMRAAVQMFKPDKTIGSWPVPYSAMRTAAAGKSAYPGTMLISTDVPLDGTLKHGVAKRYSDFLNFAASTGQIPGTGNGQLPPGYLPMTAANGLGSQVAYTKKAAAAVLTQAKSAPSVVPGHNGPHPTKSTSPSPTGNSSSSPSSTGGNSVPPVSTPPSGGDSSPTVAGSSSGTPASTIKTAPTASVTSTTSGVVFPAVLLMALLAGIVTLGLWRLDRPKAKS